MFMLPVSFLFDHLIYLTSMITRTISYDINECITCVFSWYEHLLASFLVLVNHHC